jgi:uncharacterized membrane protein YjgN (DUF898 family)
MKNPQTVPQNLELSGVTFDYTISGIGILKIKILSIAIFG